MGNEKVKGSHRPLMAAIGCTLILATGVNASAVVTAVFPQIIAGMNTTLTIAAAGFSVGTIVAFVGSLVGSKLIAKLTPKWSLLIGTICAALFVAIVGTTSSVPLWYAALIINGLVLSIGAYVAAAGVIAEFYGDKTQQVFGVVMGVAGLVAAALIFLQSRLLITMDYRSVLMVFSAGILIIGLFANLVLIGTTPSQRKKKESATTTRETNAGRSQADNTPEVPGLTLKEATKTGSFYVFFVAMFFCAFPPAGFSTFASTFYMGNGLDASTAAAWISLFSLIGALLSMGSGVVATKFGSRVLSLIVFLGFAIGTILLLMWVSTGQVWLAYLGIVFASTIMVAVIIPSLTIPELFGMKDYTGINSMGMAAYYLGAVVTSIAFSIIATAIGVNMAMLVLAILSVVSLALFLVSLAISPMKRHHVTEHQEETATSDLKNAI